MVNNFRLLSYLTGLSKYLLRLCFVNCIEIMYISTAVPANSIISVPLHSFPKEWVYMCRHLIQTILLITIFNYTILYPFLLAPATALLKHLQHLLYSLTHSKWFPQYRVSKKWETSHFHFKINRALIVYVVFSQ